MLTKEIIMRSISKITCMVTVLIKMTSIMTGSDSQSERNFQQPKTATFLLEYGVSDEERKELDKVKKLVAKLPDNYKRTRLPYLYIAEEDAFRNGHLKIVEYLLSDAVPGNAKPTQKSVERGFILALMNENQSIAAYLLSDAVPDSLKPTQKGVEEAFISALRDKNQSIAAYLSSDAVPNDLKPTQKGVEEAFIKYSYEESIIAYFLSDAVPNDLKPTQKGVEEAFIKYSYKESRIAYFLSDAVPDHLKPTQNAVEQVFIKNLYTQSIVAYLLSDAVPDSLKPTQNAVKKYVDSALSYVNSALSRGIRDANIDILAFVLSDKISAELRPDEWYMVNALGVAASNGHKNMVEYILSDEVQKQYPFSTTSILTVFSTTNILIVPKNHNQTDNPELFQLIRDRFHISEIPAKSNQFSARDALYLANNGEAKKIRDVFEELQSNERSAPLLRANLPSFEDTEGAFVQISQEFINVIRQIQNVSSFKREKNLDFRLETAIRAMKLYQGDVSVQPHTLFTLEKHIEYSHDDISVKQLIVLAYRLLKPSIITFVRSTLVTQLNNQNDWMKWSAPFANRFPSVANQASVTLGLSADEASGNHFINFITQIILDADYEKSNIDFQIIKKILPIHMKYLKLYKERLIPLIEGLFMTRRGHNINLLAKEIKDMPACPEGAYLNILKAITQNPDIIDIAGSFLEGVEIIQCGS